MAKNKNVRKNFGRIERVEPPCWWTGMRTSLQLMIYGGSLEGADIRVVGDGLRIEGVRFGESPNYMFVDIALSDDTRPGTYTFEISKEGKTVTFDYEILRRRRGSANRKSYDSADMVYLIMPDRFANGDPSNDSTDDTAEKANRQKPDGRHGGDLQGVIDHLDYIADLGVTTLWLTPPPPAR